MIRSKLKRSTFLPLYASFEERLDERKPRKNGRTMAPAPSKKRGNSLGVRLWNWAVNAWPIGLPPDRPNPEPATEMTQTGPPSSETLPPPPLVDAVTCGKSSDNAQNCRQYFDRFVRSSSRPIDHRRVRSDEKVRRGKKSLNRSINGRKEEKKARSRVSRVWKFHFTADRQR